MRTTILLFVLSIITSGATAQLALGRALPLPSGKFNIGYHRFEWTDTSRKEILSASTRNRSVVADIWYPTENAGGVTVHYLDTMAAYRAFGARGLRLLLGTTGAALIRSGNIRTHAKERAPFDHRLKTSPVIFFSHGMGMITQVYTTQIEDLVSHGYTVVALTHPYDAWLASLQDSSLILFEKKQREAAGTSEEQQITYENKRVEWWAADIRFALDQLAYLNRKESDIPFAGHLDLSRVGAMGHSVGGRAAARACQLDARIRSCADQDGVVMMMPFYPGPDGTGMKQPFLLFERDRITPPTDEELKSMGMSRQEVETLVARLRANRDAVLAATGGSYRVVLHFDSSTHMSFSDLPILQASTNAEAALASRVLQVTCRYTLEFFDKTLRGISAPLYEGKEQLNYIDLVRRYPKAGNTKHR
ncbi:MAG: hypothetical protein JO301_08270 [Chitinophagaceae bacterium]|nr:hypothetical protein [Chitinophagaceae bacterium]